MQMYDIGSLLLVIQNYRGPKLSIDETLSNTNTGPSTTRMALSGGGGGDGVSIFAEDEDAEIEAGLTRQDRIDQITGLIQDTVGQQEDWAVYGGALNSIRELNGNLFIRATPPEHAQIRPRRGR